MKTNGLPGLLTDQPMHEQPQFPKHASEACPRCGEVFTCKVNSILKCDCLTIRLSRTETQYIRDLSELQFGSGCLCLPCLRALQAEFQRLNPVSTHV
jgi:hypothetical protein